MSLHAIGRSRAARRWLGGLAVLVLALRALAPTGFMLERVDGQLSMVLCSGAAPTPGMPGMHHGPHPGGQAGHPHHLAAAASCPFALSGGASLFAAQALKVPDPYFVVLRPTGAPTLTSLAAAPPPRHQAPRGPPALV
jgi:hypothetical protein